MSPEDHDHVVAAARTTIEPGRSLEVRAVTTRTPAAAVLLCNQDRRRVVIVEQRSGVWTAPTMLSESPWDPHTRPEMTTGPWALAQMTRTESGAPQADGTPPVDAWTAVTGVAAPDATSVLVRSALDEHEAPVGPDGVVLALLRSPWRGPLDVVVRTSDGDVVRTAPR